MKSIAPLLEFYRQNGPSGFARFLVPDAVSNYGIEGFLVQLVGNRVPHDRRHEAPAAERKICEQHREEHAAKARGGMDVKEALAFIRHAKWEWHANAQGRR